MAGLVVPNGWSPEHGPHEDGVAYCQQIVWNHFTNTIEAADILGEHKEFRAQLAAARRQAGRAPGGQVGPAHGMDGRPGRSQG